MDSRNEMIGELQRLERELQRLAQEIQALHRKLDAPLSGRTQAFGAVPASGPPTPRASSKHTDTIEIPTPMPSPSTPPKTHTRTIPPSGAPKRAASPAFGINDAPPTPTRRRDSPATPADMGRYGFVAESKRPSSRR